MGMFSQEKTFGNAMYEIRSSWSSLVQLMACHLAGDRPLFEAVMTKLVGFKKIYIVV